MRFRPVHASLAVHLGHAFVAASSLCAVVVASIVPLACGHDQAPRPDPSAAHGAKRIVCGTAAATEFVCRIVGADRVAGLPEQADDWGSLDLHVNGFERVPRYAHYTAEPVLVLAPDLVVTHEWQNADTTNVLRGRGIDIVVLKSATSYDDIRATLLSLGTRLGADDKARELVEGLDARVKRLADGATLRRTKSTMVFSNDGTGGSTAGSNTTPDTMIRLAGLKNAAADAGLKGHVSIDFEQLLTIDPDFLVVSSPARGEGGSPTKTVVETTESLARLRARRPGHIIVLTPALMSADSPPLVDAAELVAREVDRVLANESSGQAPAAPSNKVPVDAPSVLPGVSPSKSPNSPQHPTSDAPPRSSPSDPHVDSTSPKAGGGR